MIIFTLNSISDITTQVTVLSFLYAGLKPLRFPLSLRISKDVRAHSKGADVVFGQV